jgi:hypothetical protein
MWISSPDGSAAEPPTPDQIERWRRRTSPPENEFPAAVGLSVLLGRSDDAAVGLTQVEVFSTGFRFTLAVRVRREQPQFVPGGLFMFIGSRHPGAQVPIEDRLLLGLEYSDGQRASTLTDARMQGPGALPDGEHLLLVPQGGGGGELSVDQGYWVSPLPPDGPLDVVLAWPSFGMPESRTALDGGVIRAAAPRSQTLWPPQPPPGPRQPPPAPRPSSGWFADPPG